MGTRDAKVRRTELARWGFWLSDPVVAVNIARYHTTLRRVVEKIDCVGSYCLKH